MEKGFAALIIFTLTLFINLLNVVEAFECPISDGFFIDPEDPHYYYKCEHSRPFHFECPGDLVFNVELKQCDWPTADVSRKPSTTTTTETPVSTESPSTRTRHVDDTTTVIVAHVNTDSSSPTTLSTSTTPAITTTTEAASTRGRHEIITEST